MMASSSSVITCINSSLDVMEALVPRYLYKDYYTFKKQRYRLRTLVTFVLLAGKFGNDVHLGSLLTAMEDAVRRMSLEDLDIGKRKEKKSALDEVYNRAGRIASDFQCDFRSLKEGVDGWCIAASDHTRQSYSLSADVVGQIYESVLHNLVDLPRFSPVLAKPTKPLREGMKFLKNFCRFATSRGVDHGQMKDFLTHTIAVAISAAHLCFLCGDAIVGGARGKESDRETDGQGWLNRMQSKISILMQEIKPADLEVCVTYTQLLSCSKLSTRIDASTDIKEMADDSTIVMKNFFDSLLFILREMLQPDTSHVPYLEDYGQVLYKRVRSLGIILEKLQPKDIDEKTRDDIGVMLCDAGALVCSFCYKNVQIDLGLQDLWKRIKVFLPEVKEEVPQTSTFNPSSINEPGLVDILLENLMELTNRKVEPIVQRRRQSIEEVLLYLRTFLGKLEELRHEQEELQALWNRVLEVTYRLEFLIGGLMVGDISDSFSLQFDSVMEDIQNIKTDADPWKSSFGKRQDIKVNEVSSTSSHVLPSQKIASLTTEVVGFHDEARWIMDRLQRGSDHLLVIAIVGMAGIGKTTLAARVYNDPGVMNHFQVLSRCTVSETLDKRRLFLELLGQIHSQDVSEMTEQDLAEELRKHLKAKRYLIFLDDVWTIEAWDSLKVSFPNDLKQSRIILTSRNHDVVPAGMRYGEPLYLREHLYHRELLYLREFNKEESLELLQRKLFSGEVWPPALYDLGMQIVEICKGLPLTIVLVAGLLAAREQERWKEIVDGFSSGIASTAELCMNTMERTYKHLPNYLKPCFLYFAAFPEGREISVRRLIHLWIAEGFIRKSDWKPLEDVAEGYMKDLIGRSIIKVAKQGSMGGVKTYRIHDLVRGFCLRKAKDEHFFHVLKRYDELLAFNEPGNLRRLCIHSEPKHLKKSKVFFLRARSILLFPSGKFFFIEDALKNIFPVHIFKLVRVLHLEGLDLGDVFPSEIEVLVQLRYLAVQGTIRAIPSWVGNLSMLETFIVISDVKGVWLPDTIWNLQKLKYFCIRTRNYFSGGGELPVENLVDNSVLYKLDTLGVAVFTCGDSMEKQMRKFPNIRRLKCSLRWDDTEVFYNIGVPGFLSRLESLHMIWCGFPVEDIKSEFSFPANLKKLTLRGFGLPWSKISTIGKLPNLEVLKLLGDSFIGERWDMKEGEFRKLRYLKLSGLDLVTWTGSDDQFDFLEKLVLEECLFLEEMLSFLESMPKLDTIEVLDCSPATVSFVKNIEAEQAELGASYPTIRWK